MSNGSGGLDWAGLDVVAELLGVHDIDALVRNLATLKLHRPPEENDNKRPEDET